MKLITRDTDYAVRALCCVAEHDSEVVTVGELVSCLKIPRPFLRKILQKLNKRGLLKSYKGRGGGFTLSVMAESISLFDLMMIFQGPVKVIDHTFKKRPCKHQSTCALKKRLDKLERLVLAELKKTTIRLLINDKLPNKFL